MRRITFALMSTLAVLVLLFSYRTSTSGPATTTAAAGAAPEGVVGDGSGTTSTAGPTPAPTAAARNVTVNGPTVSTRWGPVQVQVKIKSGKITDIVVLAQPTGERRDVEINSYALPILHDQVIAAQNANIDGVSGATVTSEGYVRSLQAALDDVGYTS